MNHEECCEECTPLTGEEKAAFFACDTLIFSFCLQFLVVRKNGMNFKNRNEKKKWNTKTRQMATNNTAMLHHDSTSFENTTKANDGRKKQNKKITCRQKSVRKVIIIIISKRGQK